MLISIFISLNMLPKSYRNLHYTYKGKTLLFMHTIDVYNNYNCIYKDKTYVAYILLSSDLYINTHVLI